MAYYLAHCVLTILDMLFKRDQNYDIQMQVKYLYIYYSQNVPKVDKKVLKINFLPTFASGLHRDLTGTYDNTFYVGGGSLFGASLTLLLAAVCRWNTSRKSSREKQEQKPQ